MDMQERFEKKFSRESPESCWLWSQRLKKGYGQFRVGRAMRRAHRVAYELHVGPIPEGLQVLHRCDVRNCVNPAHLFIGTNADNMADRNVKNRQASGERIGNSKLTEADVREIRAADGVSQRRLAASYGVTQALVSSIRRRECWVHI